MCEECLLSHASIYSLSLSLSIDTYNCTDKYVGSLYSVFMRYFLNVHILFLLLLLLLLLLHFIFARSLCWWRASYTANLMKYKSSLIFTEKGCYVLSPTILMFVFIFCWGCDCAWWFQGIARYLNCKEMWTLSRWVDCSNFDCAYKIHIIGSISLAEFYFLLIP